MNLCYGLILNNLTDTPDDYRAVVTDNETVTEEKNR